MPLIERPEVDALVGDHAGLVTAIDYDRRCKSFAIDFDPQALGVSRAIWYSVRVRRWPWKVRLFADWDDGRCVAKFRRDAALVRRAVESALADFRAR
jgi:hypothetical protein